MWTASVCFLCVKTFNSDSKHKQNVKIKFSKNNKRFAMFSERFLKLPPDVISILCSERSQSQSSSRTSSSSFLDQFCSECLEIIQATFQLFNELCEMQLKLAWRLGQWESLLKVNETSKPSSKLSSLLHRKLSEQLQVHLGMGKDGIEEVRKMRNLLLTHCKSTRNGILDRNLKVTLDRCSVPFPVATHGKSCSWSDSGTTTFLVLDSSSDFSNEQDVKVDVDVKQELEQDDIKHEDDDDHHHHPQEFEAMDLEFETDFDISNSNNQSEDESLMSASISSTETESTLRKRRSSKTTQESTKNVKVENLKFTTEKVTSTPTPAGDEIPCELCGKMIPSLKQLKKHYNMHNEKWRKRNKRKGPPTPFQCHFCWQRFTTQQMRWVHQEIGSHDRAMTSVKFNCFEELCKGILPFSTFKDLETHFENVHGNESVHKCSLCEWPFSSDDLRQVHELVHGNYSRSSQRDEEKNKPFKCPRCECPPFRTFPPLQTHFISEHTNLDSERIHKCHKCSMAYRMSKSLAQHLKTHEMEEELARTTETGMEVEAGSSNMSKYHICEKCGKHCATYRLLSEHKSYAHRTEQCSLCGEILSASIMSRHRWHVHKVADDPHPCPVCQKMFHIQHKMRRHLENVHGQAKGQEKAEPEGDVCHICSKKYQRRGLLHRHLRVAHQIEAEGFKRPAKFVCPECGMGYYYKSSLDQHVDAKHRSSEERKHNFPCTLCSKTFWRKCVLNKHLKEAHPHQ